MALVGLAASGIAGVVSISPCAFRPYDSVSDNERTWYTHETELYVIHSLDGPYFLAAVNLPHGATIKKMTVYVTDMGTGLDDEVRVRLYRQNLSTGVQQEMAYVCNHSSPALPYSTSRQAMVDSTISYKTISNNSYTYYVFVHFIMDCTDKVRFNGMKIEY
jgi:hypothetical protein